MNNASCCCFGLINKDWLRFVPFSFWLMHFGLPLNGAHAMLPMYGKIVHCRSKHNFTKNYIYTVITFEVFFKHYFLIWMSDNCMNLS